MGRLFVATEKQRIVTRCRVAEEHVKVEQAVLNWENVTRKDQQQKLQKPKRCYDLRWWFVADYSRYHAQIWKEWQKQRESGPTLASSRLRATLEVHFPHLLLRENAED